MCGHVGAEADDEDPVARISQGLRAGHGGPPALVLRAVRVVDGATAVHRVGPVGEQDRKALPAVPVGVGGLLRIQGRFHALEGQGERRGTGNARVGHHRPQDTLVIRDIVRRRRRAVAERPEGGAAVDVAVGRPDGLPLLVVSALKLTESHADVETRVVVGEDLAVPVVVQKVPDDVPRDEVAGTVGSVAGHFRLRLVKGARADRVAVTLEDRVATVGRIGRDVARLVVVVERRVVPDGRTITVGGVVIAGCDPGWAVEDVPRRVPLHAPGHVEDDHGLGGHVRKKPRLRAGFVGFAVLGKGDPRPAEQDDQDCGDDRDRRFHGCLFPISTWFPFRQGRVRAPRRSSHSCCTSGFHP